MNRSRISTIDARVSIDGGEPMLGTLEVAQDLVDVTRSIAVKPDRAWSYVDPAGHFHAFSVESEMESEWVLPTLDRIVHAGSVDLVCDDEDCERPHDGGYKCRICRAAVAPRFTHFAPPQRFMPGMKRWRILLRLDRPAPALPATVMVTADVPASPAMRRHFGVGAPAVRRIETGVMGTVVGVEIVGIGALGELYLDELAAVTRS